MKVIKDFENKILLGNCIEVMKTLPENSIDLIFADPPYNIGLKYDTHNDSIPYEDYINWSEEWLTECSRLLKNNGSIYIAINDEHAAELVLILKKLGLQMRNWLIWHYTFGQAQRKKFSRAHTHILYFTKSNDFTFNPEEIRIKSVRQLIGDKRANPEGKIPDDVWTVSRIAGTFKERIKDFPCQMPEKILETIVNASSNKGDIVLDPFSGSGTTSYVAKKLGRKYIGIEKSEKYYKMSTNRIKSMLSFE